MRMLIACAQAGGARVVLSSFATLHDTSAIYDDGADGIVLTTLQRDELFSILNFTPGLSLDGIFGGLERYNAILEQLSDEHGTGWVDNAELVEHQDENFLDRVHFSRAGASRMAENFFPIVIEQLNAQPDPDALSLVRDAR